MTDVDFWKSFNIRNSIQYISESWNKVTFSCFKGAWKKIAPSIEIQDTYNKTSILNL